MSEPITWEEIERWESMAHTYGDALWRLTNADLLKAVAALEAAEGMAEAIERNRLHDLHYHVDGHCGLCAALAAYRGTVAPR